ncbi:ribosomal subunit interface protein [Thiocapsa imhoffii]|uniref:Ribosomal subunit interface protein n=2 Tax=Thiocapsa imhoffii TaxID=382777 RepID=A0A9X1BA55_9GAMM|nr:ribosomal subunit interface protein [Thiocapsa imhoffii]
MRIQINTDRNIEIDETMEAPLRDTVEDALSRFSDHITRVEIHLSDESADRSGPHDMRCMMEARLEGRQPIAITHQAATMEQAVNGAAEKLTSAIESILGRQRAQRQRLQQADALPDEATSPDEP